jgi:anti-sigma factor RsiW
MNCRQLAELLIDYVAGELPPEHCEHVRQHLHCCPPCLVFLETYQVTIRLTRQLPPAPLPQQLVERLRAALGDICQGRKPEAGPGEACD